MSYIPSDVIKNAIKNNKLSHAYLFYGDKGVDVEKHTFDSIKMVIENKTNKKINVENIEQLKYYDLQFVQPDKNKNEILKETINEAILKLFETSLEKKSIKILYIKDIDAGNKFSLNRLLKFIEEPVENLIIFMDTNNINNVISTIRSRAQNIFIRRENIKTKINSMIDIQSPNIVLLAHIYSNVKQVKEIDLKLFDKTYNQLMEAFNLALKDKYLFKEKMFEIWAKQNNSFVLDILQHFFYQIMVEVDLKNPLFPKQDILINSYKVKNIDCFKIHNLIQKTKNSLNYYANFNLQKIRLLNEIELHLK